MRTTLAVTGALAVVVSVVVPPLVGRWASRLPAGPPVSGAATTGTVATATSLT